MSQISSVTQTDTSAESWLLENLLHGTKVRVHSRDDRLRLIKQHVYDAAELTLLYEQDLVDTNMFPIHIIALRKAMGRHGLNFLHPRRSKIRAMLEYYGGLEKIPVRMLFFGSPVAAKLERGGVTTLGRLLQLTPTQLAGLSVRPKRKNRTPRLRMILNRFDVFEVKVVLTEHSLCLRDGRPVLFGAS